MKPLVGQAIILMLVLAFSGLAAVGAYLVVDSVQPEEPSEAELEVSATGVKLKITTFVPGLVICLVGAAGLLLVAIRVPVKQIIGYEAPGSGGDVIQLVTARPSLILSEQTERVPLLLWWLPQIRQRAVRVDRT